jgi:hypothetical protein
MMFDATNVVPFKGRRPAGPQRHPKSLMEAVYAAGSLTLPADDVASKMAAAMLHALGFFVIDEILADGTPRRLDRQGVRESLRTRPWRVLRPGFSGEAGLPDADGAFAGKPL